MKLHKIFSSAGNDIPAGLVVFLVALPLCLGISLASGAPLISGLITGIIGGTIVAVLSGSRLSVSGPAAGLTVIILNALGELGSFEALLLATVFAGILQIIFGLLKGGVIGLFFPSSVIKGMLAAIGLILILKQLPVLIGFSGGESFFSGEFSVAALAAGLVALLTLVIWDLPSLKTFKIFKLIPGALIAVIAGVITKFIFDATGSGMAAGYMVNIPSINSFSDLQTNLFFPDFSAVFNPKIYVIAGTIAVIASLETLLSIDAVDKIDPERQQSPRNRELIAQGAGNILAGLVGGLPMTAVIVRSSANVNAGGKTKLSVVLHGFLLLLALFAFPAILNHIPLPTLAAILVVTGYKLCKPSLFLEHKKRGSSQLIPFLTTVVAILLTDLLVGIIIGMSVSLFFLLRRSRKINRSLTCDIGTHQGNRAVKISLNEQVTFLNKPALLSTFDRIPENSHVIIDGTGAKFIDIEVLDLIKDFCSKAGRLNIRPVLHNIPSHGN